MRHLERSAVRKDHRSKWVAIPLAGLLITALAACTPQQSEGWMPGEPGTSNIGDTIATFWVNSWITLVLLGILVWGLIIWSLVVYRRRKNDKGLPRQLRYHMPIEILFTVVPVILIAGLFAFTVRDTEEIDQNFAASQDTAVQGEEVADVHIQVYGKQWAWDFNYLEAGDGTYDGGVYSQGIQAQPILDETGATTGEINMEELPELYIPQGANVLIDLKSRDVAHSFWVIDFHYKEDTIPGKTNQMSLVADRVGTYIGKCAELCGEYHSMMLFEVHVVPTAEYNAYIQSLREQGNVGALGDEYNRNNNMPGTAVPTFEPTESE